MKFYLNLNKETNTNCFNLLGISPVKVHGKPFCSRKSLGNRKINSATDAITEKVAETLTLTKIDLDNTLIVGNEDDAKQIHEKAAQFDQLMSLIKGKVLSCKTSHEKIQYLTPCPCEWSIDKCSISKFDNSKIQRFRQRKWCFIRAIANEREINQSASHEMKEEIVSFYEDDKIFRIMPGKKDYVSIGRNIHKQKRLLPVNLKGLQTIFKLKYPRQIGFSKFSVYA